MQEDAKNSKFILQGEGYRKRGVSSWRSIIETELQKQHAVSPQVPDLREADKKRT